MSIQLNYELLFAVNNNDIKKVREVLEIGADPNALTLDKSHSALIIATKHKNQEIIKLLLNKGANPAFVNSAGKTAVTLALENNAYSLLPALYAKSPPHLRGKIVQQLNLANKNGWTPLLLACLDNDIAAVKALSEIPGVDLNKAYPNGRTPLAIAASKGHTEIVKTLINSPIVDINLATSENLTPLMLAAYSGQIEVTKLLINSPGIDIVKKNVYQQTAYDIAKSRNQNEIIQLLSIDQNTILAKIEKYLKLQLKHNGKHYQEDEIDAIIFEMIKGECNGFSGLWMYRKSLDEETQFFSILRLMSKWDETLTSLNEGNGYLQQIFEQFINDCRWIQDQANMMQYRILQKDMAKSFGIIKGNKGSLLREEFHFNYIVLESELTELLSLVLNDRKQINLRGPDHVMSIMLKDGIYYAYDPNDREGEITFNNLKDLQDYIQDSLYTSCGHSTEKMPIALTVSDLASQEPYPYIKSAQELLKEFMQKNNDVNRNIDDYNALIWASEFGDLATIQQLLSDSTTNINFRQTDNWSAIIMAANRGSDDIVQELINDPRINLKDFFEAMMEAALHHNKESMRIMAHAASVNLRDPYIQLLLAATMGDSKRVKTLLKEESIDVHKTDELGRSALLWAIEGSHRDTVKVLLEYGKFDINKADNKGITPVIAAVRLNNQAIFNDLIKIKGVQLNTRDKKGWTALMSAVYDNKIKSVQAILSHAEITSREIWPAFIVAKLEHNNEIAGLLAKHQGIKQNDPWVQLMIASGLGSDKKVTEIISNNHLNFKMFVNRQDAAGFNPLIWACIREHDDIARTLLINHADPNMQDYEGISALMWAAQLGNIEIIELLIKHPDTNLFLRDTRNRTALSIAEEFNQEEVVEILKQAMLHKEKEIEKNIQKKPVIFHDMKNASLSPTLEVKDKEVKETEKPLSPHSDLAP